MARLDYPGAPTGEEAFAEAGFLTRWMWVYFSPRKAFTAVARRPKWLAPFLLLVVLSGVVAHMTGPINRDYMKQRIEQSDKIPEEQKDQMLDRMTGGTSTVGEIIRVAGGAVFAGVVMLVLGAIFLLINNLILGGTAKYAQGLGAAAYTCLLWIPSWIIKTPLMMVQHTVNVSMGPAAFLPAGSEGSWGWAALTRVDVFGIWHIILACVALSCIGDYTAKKASSAVVPLWVLYSAVVTAVTWFGFRQLG